MPNSSTILQKIFAIQKEIKTFAVSEESGRVDPKTGKASYRFTPGWEIVEKIRVLMDKQKLLLVPNYRIKDATFQEFPVPVQIGDKLTSFQKKDALVTVEADYTWFDVDSGESFGPWRCDAANMNNIDKSAVSAISFSERYFLLKFFHITTHDTADEPDFNDPTGPAAPQGGQPYYMQQNTGGFGPAPAYHQPAQAPAPAAGPAPAYRQGAPAPAPVPTYPAPATIPPQGAMPRQQFNPEFDDQNPDIAGLIERLSHFGPGTPTFQSTLNAGLGELAAKGYNCMTRPFIANLTEGAAARRENRPPQYA